MKKLALATSTLLLFGVIGCNSEEAKKETAKNIANNINKVENDKVENDKDKNIVVDTGQNITYGSDGLSLNIKTNDLFFGQDANYKGAPFNFKKSKNGVTVLDQNTGITWQRIPPEAKSSWGKAKEYCANLELAGHNDWRLPSLKELMSIEDFEEGWPYIDTNVFSLGNQPIGKQLQYWSSNFYLVGTTHDGAETAFGLNYGTGHIKGYPTGDGNHGAPPFDVQSGKGPAGVHSKSGLTAPPGIEGSHRSMPPPPGGEGGRPPRGNPAHKLVRCVYGASYGENSFVDNGNGTVSDFGTGLMWRKNDSGKGLDWENALAYAENLEFASHDDWRLPNIKELQSIVDYSGVYPAIDLKYFNITDNDSYFWSSTSAYFSKYGTEEQRKYYWAWYVAFGYAVGPDGKDSHGAGAVRYDSKMQDGPVGEDAERVFNYARAVRNIDTTD